MSNISQHRIWASESPLLQTQRRGDAEDRREHAKTGFISSLRSSVPPRLCVEENLTHLPGTWGCKNSSLHDRDMVTTPERGRAFWRGVGLAGALVAAVAAVGAPAERRADDRVEHPRPLGFAPASGSIEGGRLVFV